MCNIIFIHLIIKPLKIKAHPKKFVDPQSTLLLHKNDTLNISEFPSSTQNKIRSISEYSDYFSIFEKLN